MGMSTHVVGFRPQDSKWDEMKAVYNSCRLAGIPVPDQVNKFFDYEDPNKIPGLEIEIKDAVSSLRDDYKEGFDVDITKLPKDCQIVRFYNSY